MSKLLKKFWSTEEAEEFKEMYSYKEFKDLVVEPEKFEELLKSLNLEVSAEAILAVDDDEEFDFIYDSFKDLNVRKIGNFVDYDHITPLKGDDFLIALMLESYMGK
ncbi:hypothetical protein [Vibrio phage Va2]|nr:hypothetical protein [Vibrio phage Va2]